MHIKAVSTFFSRWFLDVNLPKNFCEKLLLIKQFYTHSVLQLKVEFGQKLKKTLLIIFSIMELPTIILLMLSAH